ncbi:MAG: hypothetical protein KDI46_07390 [Alphaproteobacteria bacterium]|nr:hypothetical protein [Alphaproteobacteria bacterium]
MSQNTQNLDLFRRFAYNPASFNTPIETIDGEAGADDLVVVHLDRFAGMNAQQAEAAIQPVIDLIDARTPKDDPLLMSDIQKFKSHLPALASKAAKEPVLAEGGGAFALKSGMIFMDDRACTPENLLRSSFNIPPNKDIPLSYPMEFQTLHREFTRLHEGAHAILGTKESGSDFMAASSMLRTHPQDEDVRDFLSHTADLRYAASYMGDRRMQEKYGVENYDAIRHALDMDTTGQLPSLDHLEELSLIAEQHDAKNDNNNFPGVGSTEILDRQNPAVELGSTMTRIGEFFERHQALTSADEDMLPPSKLGGKPSVLSTPSN